MLIASRRKASVRVPATDQEPRRDGGEHDVAERVRDRDPASRQRHAWRRARKGTIRRDPGDDGDAGRRSRPRRPDAPPLCPGRGLRRRTRSHEACREQRVPGQVERVGDRRERRAAGAVVVGAEDGVAGDEREAGRRRRATRRRPPRAGGAARRRRSRGRRRGRRRRSRRSKRGRAGRAGTARARRGRSRGSRDRRERPSGSTSARRRIRLSPSRDAGAAVRQVLEQVGARQHAGGPAARATTTAFVRRAGRRRPRRPTRPMSTAASGGCIAVATSSFERVRIAEHAVEQPALLERADRRRRSNRPACARTTGSCEIE